MSAPLHSPAPFFADETPLCFIIRDAIGDSMGTLALHTGDHPIEEQRANAHLFAGSGELLAAAKGMLAEWERLSLIVPIAKASNQNVNRLIGAIAKAEGREP